MIEDFPQGYRYLHNAVQKERFAIERLELLLRFFAVTSVILERRIAF